MCWDSHWVHRFAATCILLTALLSEKQNPCDDLSRCLVLDTESHSLSYFVHVKTKEVHYFVDEYVQLVSYEK